MALPSQTMGHYRESRRKRLGLDWQERVNPQGVPDIVAIAQAVESEAVSREAAQERMQKVMDFLAGFAGGFVLGGALIWLLLIWLLR